MTVFAARDCKRVQSLMDDFLSGELIVETKSYTNTPTKTKEFFDSLA